MVKGYKLFVGGAIAVFFLVMAGLSIPFLNYEATQNEMYVAANTWNLPRILPHHTERKGLIDRINSKFSEQAHRKGALIVGLQGLGGIGKTTLAKYIVTHPQKEYSFIGWFHAETPELLESEYCNLGQKHNLFSKSAPDHLKIHLVKEWINRQDNALLVYDNVPNMEMLEDFLPHNGDIIITSRNYKIPNVIKIGAMTEEESLSLLDKLIPMGIQNQEGYAQQVRELASMLGHLPLALSQAGYYIHENNLTVGEFLSLYEANKAKLLSEDSMPPADQHAPAYVTWDMSLQKIRETPGGGDALKVLKFISYCYPENIPMEILMQALYGDVSEELRFELNKHIKLLNQYSLIDVCPGNISIHRLVHSWAKNKDSKKEKLKGVLDVIDAMEGIYPGIEERNKSTEDIQFARKMLPHAEYVVSEWGALLDSSRFLRLITNMADAYELLGSFKKSKRRFKEALAMSEKKFGRYHPNTAMILFHLSWNNRVLGNLKKSNQKSKEALEILDKIDQSGSFLAADILSNYGLTELLLCHYANAKDILSRSMHIIEASYGEDDVNTTFPIRRLGIAYLYLGDYAKARKYLDKAARGMEKFFGKEHLEFVNVTSNLGVLHMLMGELQIAEDFLLAALRFKEEYYGLTHRSTAKAYYRLGNVYLFLRDYKKAESYYQRALNTLGELATDSKKNIYYNIYLAALGNIKRLSGESTEGLSLMEKSLENMHAYYTEHNTNTACVMANMGLVYGTMGEYDKSRKYLEKALAIFTDNLSSDHPYISQTRGEVQKSNDASRNNKKPLVGYVINIEA